jgi:hypothetical protein
MVDFSYRILLTFGLRVRTFLSEQLFSNEEIPLAAPLIKRIFGLPVPGVKFTD